MFVVEKNYPVNNHMFKIDIENTRTRCEICSKLIIKTPELFLLLTLIMICDALRDFGSNAYKRRSNGWPRRRSNQLKCV